MKDITGKIDANQKHIVILASKYNSKIVDMLYDGAVDAFCHYNGDLSKLIKIEVPGAFEIPGTINQISTPISTKQ